MDLRDRLRDRGRWRGFRFLSDRFGRKILQATIPVFLGRNVCERVTRTSPGSCSSGSSRGSASGRVATGRRTPRPSRRRSAPATERSSRWSADRRRAGLGRRRFRAGHRMAGLFRSRDFAPPRRRIRRRLRNPTSGCPARAGRRSPRAVEGGPAAVGPIPRRSRAASADALHDVGIPVHPHVAAGVPPRRAALSRRNGPRGSW